MKTRLIAMLVACTLLLSIPSQAQTEEEAPPPPRRPLEAVKSILDLTDSQAQQLADLRQSHFEQTRGLGTQIRELEQQKNELLNSTSPDPAQVGALAIQQRGLQQQVRAAAQSYHEAALALLTATQQEKVAQIQQALRLAPQAGPLAAFGLIQPPRPQGVFRRPLRRWFGPMHDFEEPIQPGPAPMPMRLFRRT